MTEYELYHHGIKGQKWGVRRTAAQLGHRVAGAAKVAGKTIEKRAIKAGRATSKFAGKQAAKAKKAAIASAKQHMVEAKEKRYYKKLHKKKLSQMTDKEIADLTKRVNAEANLKDAKYESRVKNARKFYENVAKEPLKQFGTELGKGIAKNITKSDGKNKKEASEAPAELKDPDKTFKGKVKKLIDSYEVKPESVRTGDRIDVEFRLDSDPEIERKKYNIRSNPVNIRHGR